MKIIDFLSILQENENFFVEDKENTSLTVLSKNIKPENLIRT
jgi:hypothetical protein